MINVSGLLFLSARAVSAAGNLIAVAVFTRLAGPSEYGHYLLIFAWSLIVYGFGAQWMRFAFFGVYHPQRFGEYVSSLGVLFVGGLAIVALALTGLGAAGSFEPGFLIAVFVLVCGIAVYEAVFEIARTLLYVRGMTLSMVLRAAMTVAFGSASLWLGGGARGLALAIALAHVAAALPCCAIFFKIRLVPASRFASLHILGYGWPLLLSFGVAAVGQTIDRLLLAHYLGTAVLGSYGVAADVLRQSFTVFGEVIALSLVTTAKQHATKGNLEAANAVLRKAFNACLAAAAFGTAFFIVFGDVALRLVLKPAFIAPSHALIPVFAITFAFMIMRNFYFAQVIYFTAASYLELLMSLLLFGVSTALAVTLVPTYGARGAALALMTASILSCTAFMLLGRRWYRLPVDLDGLTIIPALAVVFILGSRVAAGFAHSGNALLVFDAVVFALFGAFAIRRFGLLNAVPAAGMLEEVSTS